MSAWTHTDAPHFPQYFHSFLSFSVRKQQYRFQILLFGPYIAPRIFPRFMFAILGVFRLLGIGGFFSSPCLIGWFGDAPGMSVRRTRGSLWGFSRGLLSCCMEKSLFSPCSVSRWVGVVVAFLQGMLVSSLGQDPLLLHRFLLPFSSVSEGVYEHTSSCLEDE